LVGDLSGDLNGSEKFFDHKKPLESCATFIDREKQTEPESAKNVRPRADPQGIDNMKWPRRIHLVDRPHMRNRESRKYASPRRDEKSRWFENELRPKLVITCPPEGRCGKE
jgi:hypothetical protein